MPIRRWTLFRCGFLGVDPQRIRNRNRDLATSQPRGRWVVTVANCAAVFPSLLCILLSFLLLTFFSQPCAGVFVIGRETRQHSIRILLVSHAATLVPYNMSYT